MLGDVSNEPVRFPHIHGGDHGIRTITVDMCGKQAHGMYTIAWVYILHMLNI